MERKTRFLLIKKVWGRNAENIQKTVLQMMTQQGEEQFRSLTTDNSSEFSSLPLVEGQVSNLSVYFAHAFSSWEKGTNECHNRMLREFIPKRMSLKNLKYAELALYTEAINERPSRIFGYDTPLMKELCSLSDAT